MGSVIDALIEAKLRHLEDQFQTKLERKNEKIERLKEENKMLKEKDQKLNNLMQKLSKERENEVIPPEG